MVINVGRLKRKDLKVWLPIIEEFRILARYLSQTEYDRITKLATIVKPDPDDSTKTIQERDDIIFRRELGIAVIEAWDGVEEDGAEFPATPENIAYMMEECTELRLKVFNIPLSLELMLQEDRKANEKN